MMLLIAFLRSLLSRSFILIALALLIESGLCLSSRPPVLLHGCNRSVCSPARGGGVLFLHIAYAIAGDLIAFPWEAFMVGDFTYVWY